MNLDLVIIGVLAKWCEAISSQVRDKWDNSHGASWQKEIHHDIVTLPNIIMGEIIASGAGAFIAEFGSGSLMENEQMNPYLSDYKGSDKWNPARSGADNGFLGREAGETVYRPDGSSYQSTGKAKGLHLEWNLGKNGAYTATPPMHIIKQEVTFTMPLILAELNEVVISTVNAEVMGAFKVYV